MELRDKQSFIQDGKRLYQEGKSLYQNGEASGGKKKIREAIQLYEEAIKLDSEYAEAYYYKGNALKLIGDFQKSTGKYRESDQCYEKAIKRNSRFAKAYNKRGIVLEALKKTEQAIGCYTNATNFGCTQAYYHKGNALKALAEEVNHEAIKCYDEMIRINHENGKKNACLWNKKGQVWQALGKMDEARRCFDQAIKLSKSRDPLSYYHSGRLYNLLGQVQKALEDFQIADNLAKQNSWEENTSVEEKSFITQTVISTISELENKIEAQKRSRDMADSNELKENLMNAHQRFSKLMNTSGLEDKEKAVEGFKALKEKAPELEKYARDLSWTLINHSAAYRISSTRIIQGNPESIASFSEKIFSCFIGFAPIFEKLKFIPWLWLKPVHSTVKEWRFRDQEKTINKIFGENYDEEDISRIFQLTAIEVAFKLGEGSNISFDEPKSFWGNVKKIWNKQLGKIKGLVLRKSLDLYDGAAAVAAQKDAMRLLKYLYEHHDSVIKKKNDENIQFINQFTSIILESYQKALGNNEREHTEVTDSSEVENSSGRQRIEEQSRSEVEIRTQGRQRGFLDASQTMKNKWSRGWMFFWLIFLLLIISVPFMSYKIYSNKQ